MKQVYLDTKCELFEDIALDQKQAHHVFDVLRTSSKEVLRVVTKDRVFLANVMDKPYIHIFEEVEIKKNLNDITLCVALIKQDKFEWMLQKACELGVNRIVPFISSNTIVRIDDKKIDKKMARWNEILMSACKQCNRDDLVQLEPVCCLSQLPNYKSSMNLVAYEKEKSSSKHMAHYLNDNPYSITVCIGPEGGFKEAEIDILNENGFFSCSLGNRILRAETAACYVLSAIEYQNHVEGK